MGKDQVFRRSQLRDHAFYKANEAAILEAARAGRIFDDLPPKRSRITGRVEEKPPPPPPTSEPPRRRAGSEIAGREHSAGRAGGGGFFWGRQGDAIRRSLFGFIVR